MIIQSVKFRELIKKMLDVYQITENNMTLIAYDCTDDEGGLSGFEYFLAENIFESNRKYTYKISWISGYDQETVNLFSSSDVLNIFQKMRFKVEDDRLNEMYGEEANKANKKAWMDEENEDVERFECDLSKEDIEKRALMETADQLGTIIEKRLLRRIKDADLDNKFYGNRVNGIPVPIDKGYFVLKDQRGNIVLDVVYGTDKLEDVNWIIWKKLIIDEGILVTKSEVDSWIKKANDAGEEICVFEGIQRCNGEVVDCSLDIVTLYMFPNGKYRVKRQHMF